MLFTPQDESQYRLWTTRRCGWVLCIGIVLFSIFVFISFYFIHIRPSIEAQHISIDKQTNHITFSDDKSNAEANAHQYLESDIYIRLILKDGTSQIVRFDDWKSGSLPEHKSMFIVLDERNLWQFLYERWQLMWSSADD